ncbi:MAG: radical SAM protein [Planctomycetes bacterium]|nr:radical SAM protein [Planctomycetota bacterium]
MADHRNRPDLALRQHRTHPRSWRENLYVYPVISRRSGGLSIGINLNPDTACNFDCIYCQVDRKAAVRTRRLRVSLLGEELSDMLSAAQSGLLFDDPAFCDVPRTLHRIRDIAFSGDGEPTTCKEFLECTTLVADLKRRAGLLHVKIVLITDACYLTRPEVAAGLAVLDQNHGEIWAKLDAGTEEYYRLVNRPNVPLRQVMENIVAAATVRPIVIQSLFMRVRGEPPGEREIGAYVDRLREVGAAGGRISLVQVYTVARQPAESYVEPLGRAEVDAIAERVRTQAGLPAAAYYGG